MIITVNQRDGKRRMTAVLHFSFSLVALLSNLLWLHPASCAVDIGLPVLDKTHLFASPSADTTDVIKKIEERARNLPKKQFFVKTNARQKSKLQKDASKKRGKIIHDFSDLDISVVAFDNDADASEFATLGYYRNMEEDAPRFSMGMLRRAAAPTDEYYYNYSQGNRSNLTNSIINSQAIPYGVRNIFNGTLPNRTYYPSKKVKKTICIIDSGVDQTHPDLFQINVTAAGSQTTTSNIGNICPHGTFLTGTIVANDNNIGVIGIFPGAPVIVVKVFDATNCEWVYSSSLIAAANECASLGASIISLSLTGLVSSTVEKVAFRKLERKGILIFAAAGNDGDGQFLYPASYSSVVSVAAVDAANQRAAFSNCNSQVDITAPGVSVLSTWVSPYDVYFASAGGSIGYGIIMFQYSITPSTNITAKSCQCNATSCPVLCEDRICLIPRGTIIFSEKAIACQNVGGVSAIIYNNQAGFCNGTLSTYGVVNIPVFCTSDMYGADMVKADSTGVTFTIDSTAQPYNIAQGTSFAVPHVSGAAFLLWNKFPSCNSTEIYNAIMRTALDLGPEGRDDSYGNGLVQYWPAANYLSRQRCGNT